MQPALFAAIQCRVLNQASRIQQLSIADEVHRRQQSTRLPFIFPLPSAAPFPLSRLTYLDFLHGLTLVNLTSLLAAKSPPIFAAQLTHLALRVHSDDRRAAAASLSSLPSLYPSLTHVHIGVQDKLSDEQSSECVVWDAVMQRVRAAVGAAWCDSADDVVAWREDVMWRREVGLPLQGLQPYYKLAVERRS